MPKKSPDPIDILVGNNLRILRQRKGLSQTDLGRELGLTFQQIQKYEKGTNRVGAGRLYRMAAFLGVPVSALFDGAPKSSKPEHFESPMALLSRSDAVGLMEAFSKVSAPESRRLLVGLARQLASPGKR